MSFLVSYSTYPQISLLLRWILCTRCPAQVYVSTPSAQLLHWRTASLFFLTLAKISGFTLIVPGQVPGPSQELRVGLP